MHLQNFIKQKSYEKIVALLRRDVVTFIPILVLFLILLSVPIGIYFLIRMIFPALLFSPISFPLLVLAASVYYLSIILFFYVLFVDYYLDVWIVTNDRLINIEQRGLFFRTVSELDLFNIQDATSEVSGFFATVFNYGNVYVQSAGTTPRFILQNVPDPNKIRQQILDLSEEDKKFHDT